jgi:peptidoglycan/LPS O-acetylase OafA/YrhL
MVENISFTNIIPPIIVMSLLFIAAWFLLKNLPFYRKTTELQKGERYETLDGLRGLLALGVFFQHVVTNYTYITTGVWQITDFTLFRNFGGEAVIIFFMITSFLYWSKAIAEKGKVDAEKLYKSRFYRLAPMYLFSASIVVIIALFATNFHIVSPIGFVKDIFSWLSLGINTTISTNGYSIMPINAGIHWTLHFEWFFYLLLPVSALALRNKKMLLLTIPLAFVAMTNSQWGYWVIFFFGIFAAHIVERYPVVPWLKNFWAGFLPIIGLILVFLSQYKPYGVLQYCVTLLIFLCFVYGNNLFGLLKTSVAKFLGTISYSIYLLHGIVLFIVLHSVNYYYPLASMSEFSFWFVVFCTGCITIFISSLTYRYIEYPFIRKVHSKKVKAETVIEVVEQVA